MSQDLLYSILPRPLNNQVSQDKTGIKKIDKASKKGVVDEEHTTLPDELSIPATDSTVEVDKETPSNKDKGLDTYA